MDSSSELANFDIESNNFFTSSAELEVLCSCLTVSWPCPVLVLDVNMGVLQKVKLAKESVVSDVFPRNLQSWWNQGSSLGVVPIDCIANSI